MPTPKNGFQILNLHLENMYLKKYPFLMYFCLSITKNGANSLIQDMEFF